MVEPLKNVSLSQSAPASEQTLNDRGRNSSGIARDASEVPAGGTGAIARQRLSGPNLSDCLVTRVKQVALVSTKIAHNTRYGAFAP
jgi:hypothetical protein